MDVNENRLYEQIGDRLRARRREFDLTQSEVAETVGLLRTTIANIEAGRQRVSLHVLYKLCTILNLEVNEILPANSEIVTLVTPTVSTEEWLQSAPPKTAALVKRLLDEESKEENQ